jgi:RNA polymerase sigma-70 factor (ECF subfamily)
VARLTRALGPTHLELAEEAVQDAVVKALQTWGYRGVPDRPQAWLFRVARNRALDGLRRLDRWEVAASDPELVALADALEALPPPAAGRPGGLLGDDELALVFLCCHPSLPVDAAVALTLRTVGGLAIREIASAFLVPEATMAQRLVRAKRTLRRLPALEIPAPHELPARRQAVLRALYLLFNEGYTATEGDLLVRRELCAEAIRLASLLASHPSTMDAEVDALLALLLLQASRLPARTDDRGELLLLAEQDRARWDRELLGRGLAHLERAGRGDRLTPYHLEAGIAACHAAAPSFERTDWRAVVALYDLLAERAPSPVVTLNRAVAVAMRDGVAAGLAALDEVRGNESLARGHLLPSVRGWLLERAGDRVAAAAAYGRAAARTRSEPVRRHLEARAAALAAMRVGHPGG